ncbi:hypothetical protein ACFRCW_42340 [Streptomyces sp. NPDC056653]
MKTAIKTAVFLAATWLLTFLWCTPRGDRIMTQIGKALFPERLIK